MVNSNKTNLKWARRIDWKDLNEKALEWMIESTEPIVVTGASKALGLDKGVFGLDFLMKNYEGLELRKCLRDVDNFEDIEGWNLGQFCDYLLLPEKEKKRVLYGKDIPCPSEWSKILKDKLGYLFCNSEDDLVNCLPESLQPLTLMIYIGSCQSRTPGHRDLCGSLANNLMVYSDEGASAYWFCAKGSDKNMADQFWREQESGRETLDHDNQFLPPSRLVSAPFDVFVIKQTSGDFVILPPNSAHQVINLDGKNIKVAWNRIMPSTLWSSYEVLENYHSLCKPEIYRIKTIAFYALKNRIQLWKDKKLNTTEKWRKDLTHLLRVNKSILFDECIDENSSFPSPNPPPPIKYKFFKDKTPHTRTCVLFVMIVIFV
uniref:JmjC domain-containing protein n=1 Tax=Arcella intermedia TaxID=1963864 RepID=A0A6B2L733_9EUKA